MTDEENNVIEISGPPATDFDANFSLADLVLASMRKHHVKSTAEIEVETGRELTYGHLVRESLSVVQGLKAEGITENSVVAVVSYNSQECHIMFLACIFIGATVAPIDPSLNADEMAALMDLVSPTVVYTESGKTLRKVELAVSLISVSPLLVVSGKKHSFTSFQDLRQPTDPEFKPSVTNPEEHTAMILFTSGTTGLSKGVQLSDFYILNCVKTAGGKRPDAQPTVLLTSPIFWLSGVMMFFTSVLGGLRLVFLRGPAKEAVIFSAIHNYRVNIWFTSPTALRSMVNFPGRGAYDLSSLLMVHVGGAILSADSTLKIQKELFKNRTPVLQGYGMTEIGIISTSMPGLSKPGSCGVLKSGVRCKVCAIIKDDGVNDVMKVVDLESGESLGPGAEGEICLKGKYIMSGYINNPEATAAVFDDDGWFRTGDIGYYDEDGFFFIVDRIKDLIKYKSYQIAPAEIENVLRTHPVVKDVAVFGIPHPTDGDHATAYVVASKAISETQLLEFVAERVSENKRIRGGIRFVEFIPKTSTGKPKRRALRTQLLAELQGNVKRQWSSATQAKKKPTNKLLLLRSHSTWSSS